MYLPFMSACERVMYGRSRVLALFECVVHRDMQTSLVTRSRTVGFSGRGRY